MDSIENLGVNIPKIPRKPFFRSIIYNTLEEVEHVKVKLWKLHSCSINNLRNRTFFPIRSDLECSKLFCQKHSSQTLKKSLKHVKKIKLKRYQNIPYYKFFSTSWKLSSLDLYVLSLGYPLKNFLKIYINPKLEALCINGTPMSNRSVQGLSEITRHFQFLRKFELNYNSANGEIIIQSQSKDKRRKELKNLEALALEKGFAAFFLSKYSNSFKNLRSLSIKISNWNFEKAILSKLSSIPLLSSLRIYCVNEEDQNCPDLSHIASCQNLELLDLYFKNIESLNLEPLLQMKRLRRLYLECINSSKLQSFPNLSQLEGLRMNIPQNLFHLKSLRAFLMKSNLKDLGLTYSSQELNFLFKNELTLPLERLSLSLLDYEKPQFPFNILERHTDLKALDLNLDLYWDNINPILKTLTCLPKLEDLNLKLKQIPDCKEFKRILSNLVSLKSFGLEFIQELVINNVELKSLIKCFQALGEIIKFWFIANCTNRIDNSTYSELVSFVKTNKQLKSRHIRITELKFPKILPNLV